MRFVWAVAAFVLAALMIGAGIAQRTVFQGPKTETAAISVTADAPYMLIDGAVLTKRTGAQTLRAEGTGTVFAAYGRTPDLKAWLAGSTYNEASLNGAGSIVTSAVTPTPAPSPAATATATPTPTPAPSASAAAATGRNPVGSDLWLDEFSQQGTLVAPLQLPAGMSVLVASDGTAPAPSSVSISWPNGSGTPWAGPLIVLGGILMAVGVFLYILGIRHVRRSRGPRRKGLPLPVTEPIDLSVEGADKGVVSATPRRRAITGGRRAFVALPLLVVAALGVSGCSPEAWPQFDGSSSPSPSASVIVPEGQQAPAVTEAQAERILARVADTVAQADQTADQALAATRLDGAALGVRDTYYKLRAANVAEATSPGAIAGSPVKIVLPQAFDGWPRTVMAIVDNDAAKVSNVMLLTQKDPWAPYKLSYVSNLEASTQLPNLAAAYVGASQVPPDSEFLLMPPAELAAAYADVLNSGDSSTHAAQFDASSDAYRTQVAADRQKQLDTFNQTATNTGSLTFASRAGSQPPLALATLESGAIVAVNVEETDTVKPTNADAVIKLGGNPIVKALAGVDQTAKGVTTTYSDQLFFYVPSQGSSEKIRLLGSSSSILDAKVIP